MVADKNAKVANLFRFGMQMPMPRSFETVEYYGRGPVENYADRNHCTDLGIYQMCIRDRARTASGTVIPGLDGKQITQSLFRIVRADG